MKKTKSYYVFFLLPLIIGCQTTVQKKDTKTEDLKEAGYFGEKISADSIISGEKLVALLSEQDSVWVTLKSRIVSNCQRTGCWMDLDLGNEEVIKVTFKDYAFFIPLDSKGKTATIEGYAAKEMIPVDMLKHYAEDEGKSQEEIDAITEPETAYMFEAIGVIIED